MRLRKGQTQQMMETRRGLFLDVFVDFVLADLPDLAIRAVEAVDSIESSAPSLDPAKRRAVLRASAERQLRRAVALGITPSADVARFILMAFAHGADFVDRRPSLRLLLEDTGVSSSRKMSLLSAYYP